MFVCFLLLLLFLFLDKYWACETDWKDHKQEIWKLKYIPDWARNSGQGVSLILIR